MRQNLDARFTVSPTVRPDGVLHSWKEIAAYFGRSCRTVQRWEQTEGLPVRRLQHRTRGSVYAVERELAAWWNERGRAIPPAAEPAAAFSSKGGGGVARRVFSMAQRMWKGAFSRLSRT